MEKEIYYKYFEEKILPQVLPLEKQRANLVRKVLISSTLYFLAGICFAVLLIFVNIENFYKVFLFPAALFFMYAAIIKAIINFIITGREYQEMLYEKLFPLFLPPVANFKSWPKNYNTEVIIDSKLFHNFDMQEDVSSYFGFYKRTNITVSDSRLTMPVKGINKPHLFKGTLIQLEFEKSINNHVILFSKNEKKYNTFNQVNPYIPEMNRFLYVFAKNSENLEFITDKFWNIIKKFGEKYTAKSFWFSYNDNVVLIALSQKRPMLFGFLFRSLLKAKNYDELIDRFIVIFDMVDFLMKD